ncbi:MAG: type I-E CRISPR-associated protein Cas7/Cse4/CasC [Syntrophales bacterium]|nr:type I-E CRISPR-associated protein Cas7/Cse4/CasC [Syntrophales bacterium]MCK9391682.1 type I-E CRISPR-associated protein Cas7/Cse4/CasC [Syntrophales bacterium]
MSTFIQLHLLTSYPPSNLNRDDLGRPKTAVMGGKTRLRVSSQSLKRAWRTSDLFESALGGHIGKRTKKMGIEIYKKLCEKGVTENKAKEFAKKIVEFFGATESADKDKPLKDLESSQLVHYNQSEINALHVLADKIAREDKLDMEELKKLVTKRYDVDIAMFGRMLTGKEVVKVTGDPEAAVQVAHAITVHEVAVEDDYFTAVDDLNMGEEDMGAAHIGETEFGAGVFYLYLCINRNLLIENLGGDKELADKALAALVGAAAKVAPTGKQNSFASRARTSYMLAEKGNDQPRSLAVAFLKPVKGEDMLEIAVKELEKRRDNFDKVYGPCAEGFRTINAETGDGKLTDIIKYVTE